MKPSDDRISGPSDDKFLIVTPQLAIPLAEFSFTFSRSGGPGGQNVNKVNSKAQLRWNVVQTPSLNQEIRARFLAQNRHRITLEGDFLIVSQQYRDQPRNVADCLEKLRALLVAAAIRPVKRKKTKPTAGARRRRLAAKRHRSAAKELRRRPATHD